MKVKQGVSFGRNSGVSFVRIFQEYPLAGKYLQKEGNYWILDTDVYDYAGVCRFYVGLADEIKIIDSPEFAAYAKEYMARNIAKL